MNTASNELERRCQDLVAQSAERVLVTTQALHDVRSTLTLLRFCAESANRTEDPVRNQSLLQQVIKSADALAEMLGELMTYCRDDLRSLPLQPREVLLHEELDGLLGPHREQAEAKGLAFRLRPVALPGRVRLAPIGLRRILENVVGNALKFSDTGGIDVLATHTGSTLEVLVEDKGLGIPFDEQDLLFHPYQRAHRNRTPTHGLGLGLFTARQIAIAMGGDVSLIGSTPGAGSAFRITVRAEVVDTGTPL